MGVDFSVICNNGDDIQARYNAAKALRPNNQPLSPTNRAALLVVPGHYGLLTADADYVDVMPTGQHQSIPSVFLMAIDVKAKDVRISGIGMISPDTAFLASGEPGQTFTNCRGGKNSFGGVGLTPKAGGTYINCVGGNESFGSGPGAVASGTFIDCTAGDGSFGSTGMPVVGLPAPTASGIFTNCTGGAGCFGGGYGNATGIFTNCSALDASFGKVAAGRFSNCRGGKISFGEPGGVTGTFEFCVSGDGSFANCEASARILYCRVRAGGFGSNIKGTIRHSLDGNLNPVNT